ncbi:E3 ubiquitin-protein ligase PUB23-like [Silene latifolia]|uniref:E3 ubiquitin-protein ligase PUB23-like n=1 Tax=Silene latifolia TaxID=37657 RepID=UPI003D76D617
MEAIEVPSHFLCPISLQLMKDPVTIITGITYDRESIEKWLFSCKNTTCPVTKQLLISSPLDNEYDNHHNMMIITPNHTLRRLIQSWCMLHSSDGVERIPTPRQPIMVTRGYVTKLISDAKESTKLRYSCLQKIRSLLESSETRNKSILEVAGAFEYVSSILMKEYSCDRRDKEEALCIFAQFDENEGFILKGLIKNNEDYLLLIEAIIGLLRFGSAQVRENGVKVLKSIYKVADPNQLSNITFDMIVEVVNVVRDNFSNQSTKCALKLLVEINPWGRNRVKLVQAGLVHELVELLVDGLDRRSNELALVVLDQICGCAEGRAALVGHATGLAVVSKKILRVSHVASNRAVKILWSISRYLATGKVLGEMLEVGVVAKLCLVIQMECSPKTKERAKEMLKMHSRVWKMSPCIPPHLLTSYPSN